MHKNVLDIHGREGFFLGRGRGRPILHYDINTVAPQQSPGSVWVAKSSKSCILFEVYGLLQLSDKTIAIYIMAIISGFFPARGPEGLFF